MIRSALPDFIQAPFRRPPVPLILAACVALASWAYGPIFDRSDVIIDLSDGLLIAALLVTPSAQWLGLAVAFCVGRVAGLSLTGDDDMAALLIADALGVAAAVAATRALNQDEPESGPLSPASMSPAPMTPAGLARLLAATCLAGPAAAGLALIALRTDFVAEQTISLALGNFVVVPSLMLQGAQEGRPARIALVLGGTIAVALLVFHQASYPLLFLIPPVLSYATATLGARWAGIAIAAVALLAGRSIRHGLGPLSLTHSDDPAARVYMCQMFVLTCQALVLAVALAAARRAEGIAALRRERRELSLSEARNRLLLGQVRDEALYLMDNDGNVVSWNPGAERLKAYTAGEVIGRSFEMFFTPEERAAGLPAQALAAAREQGSFATQCWHLHKNGARLRVDMRIEAVRDADGAIDGFVKITRDITDRQAELEQRRIMIEAAPNGMLIVDEAGRIALANARVEEIFGYPPGTLVGEPVEVLVPEARQRAHATYRTEFARDPSQQRGMSPERQFPGRRRDGGEIMLEVLLSPVRTPRGHSFVVSLVDVTEREQRAAARREEERREQIAIAASNERLERLSRHLARARDRAELANRAKSRFLTGMTHELRTPLNGILGYAQLLLLEGELSESQAGQVEAMMKSGRHLLELINSVLDLAQIEADKVDLQPEPIDVAELAQSCLEVCRPGALSKGLDMALELPATPLPAAQGDRIRLRQVLINLLGNAVKFTQQGEVRLRVSAQDEATMLRFEVADTGPGVPPAQRDLLFKEFERLSAGASGAIEGAGLGLSIAMHLVIRMGGRIGYDDNPGGGSIFWLDMPVAVDDPAEAAAAAEPAAPGPAARLRVLVVDDVETNRVIAARFLELAGFTVICAGHGAEAVRLAGSQCFDIVLMDVRMPGMDGLEATRRIRALPPPHGAVPIVALTAQAFADDVARCSAAGMNGHISKPFEQATLVAMVQRAASSSLPPPKPVPSAPPPATTAAPVLDEGVLAATAALFKPGDLERHLQQVLDRVRGLAEALADPATEEPEALADMAHRVAGSAGMLGLRRLSTTCIEFERAVLDGSQATAPAATRLRVVIDESLPALEKAGRAALEPAGEGSN